MAAPSPSGWLIPNPDAEAFSFRSSISGVNSLSGQALRIKKYGSPRPVILPENSPGNVSETRVEFSMMEGAGEDMSAGIVFGYQDIDNYLAVETLASESGDVGELILTEKVNGTTSRLTGGGSSLPVDANQGWVDIRIQVFRPSSSEVSFRVSAADHGDKYQSLRTATFQDSELNFTSGDVGLTMGHEVTDDAVAFDGDPVGSGGRPIKMYWA